MAPIDDGTAVHYTALERGTPVYGSDEVLAGKVVEVLDNYREHIFDGLVVADRGGRPRVRGRTRGGPNGGARGDPHHPRGRGGEAAPPEPSSPVAGTAKRLFGGLRRPR